jgi:23S rRNA (uracil1939-C5)-methyltransferase
VAERGRRRRRRAALETWDGPIAEVEATALTFGGDALARMDGQVVFVPLGLPDERLRVQLRQRKPDYAVAELLDVLSPSTHRVAARCPHFGVCGGCQLQHADYAAQLDFKRHIVVEQLRRIGHLDGAEELVRPVIGMIEPWDYRNHVRFSLGRKYGDLGYTHRGTRHLLPVDSCDIAHPEIVRVLGAIQRRCIGHRAHQITVRYGCNTGDLLISPALPSVAEVESGQAELAENVLGRRFVISAGAFFQVNTRREARPLPETITGPWLPSRQTDASIVDILALLVMTRLEPEPDRTIVDAYCGVGTFAALLAPWAGSVIGIEESAAAIRDATANTSDLGNVRFIEAKTEHALGALEVADLDGVVLDPARVGCAPEVIRALVDRHPHRVVYVSCDPATLARDLATLVQGGYRVDLVEPIDMFPQTYHIESVTTLTWGL